jgi:hypothetical protein
VGGHVRQWEGTLDSRWEQTKLDSHRILDSGNDERHDHDDKPNDGDGDEYMLTMIMRRVRSVGSVGK